ncbi:MAG: hypothetical protein M3478_12060 [Planctomycetota bacterium]|nr:hypothetical protein [Planctomycetota bacterium]
MHRSLLRRLLMRECQSLLDALSMRQHLRPHEPVGEALANVGAQLDVCPNASAAALRWLDLDSTKAIGGLRRTELMQLARSVHRFWRQARPTPQAAESK